MNNFTRKQYMNQECTHSEYYAQFVTQGMRQMVLQRLGIERLQRSPDGNFKNIPMLEWDGMKNMTFTMLNIKMWRELQYPEYDGLPSVGWSYCDNTCLLKEAARQLVAEAAAVSA